MNQMDLELVGKDRAPAAQSIAELFEAYAKNITLRARIALIHRRPPPKTEAQVALHLAYSDGLAFAQHNPLSHLIPHTIRAAAAVFHELEREPEFLIDAGCVSSRKYMEGYYRDGHTLPHLWRNAHDVAEIVSYWQGLNDACQFIIAFIHYGPYENDFRGACKAVNNSLSYYGLLNERKARGHIVYQDFTPPQRSSRLPVCLPGLTLVR